MTDYQLEDPQEMVLEDTWTIDKMSDQIAAVLTDVNGDGRQDYDEIGAFLEAMGAYTYDNTLDVYLENTVIGKGMRDERSADMVRLMMKNRSFDLGEAFSLHDVMDV